MTAGAAGSRVAEGAEIAEMADFARLAPLPQQWASSGRFVVLDAAFGLGHRFLATWALWRADPQACERLVVVALTATPPGAQALQTAHAATPRAPLATVLCAAWPPPTHNLHVLDFEQGRVRLLLAAGEVNTSLRQLRLQAHALFIDGASHRQADAARGTLRLKALGRLAAPGATLSATQAGPEVQQALTAAGFEPTSGTPGNAMAGVSDWRYAPRFVPRGSRPVGGDGPERHAVVIGAGIAGACAAAALARQGWACTVLDAHAEPAKGASGNPAALVHGSVHAGDGLHARFTRAAALFAANAYGPLLARGVAGQLHGLLRAHAAPGVDAGPDTWAQRLEGAELQRLAPALRASSAWLFPQGGWVDAAATVRALLATPGVTFCGSTGVTALHRDGAHWALLDCLGHVCARASVVVLATAGSDSGHTLLAKAGAAMLPTTAVRGQVTWFEAAPTLRLPLAGHGYAACINNGILLCGASSQPGDREGAEREADHRFNLQRLLELSGLAPLPGQRLHGRVAWRDTAVDRLPIVGAAPAQQQQQAADGRSRLQQARWLQRVPGLFVLAGLAGRGYTWGPLCGEVLAALISGAPMPLPADVLDAIDPGRGLVRSARKGLREIELS